MFDEKQSLYNFNQTVEKLSEAIINGGWKIPATHDLQATLSKSGIDVLPVKVIELCNPLYSSKILKESQLRIYSVLMPCRISVYEKEDGRTYISMMDFSVAASGIGGVVEKVMTEAYHDAEKFVLTITKCVT